MLALSFMNRRDRSRALTFAGAALVLLALAGCGGTKGSEVGVHEVTARAGSDGVQTAEIEVHSFYFKPNRIMVASGKPVDLTLKFKNWIVPHNLTCEHADAGIMVDRGAGFLSFNRTKHVRFTPTKPGEYSFYCGVGGHMKKGMTGSIVVR